MISQLPTHKLNCSRAMVTDRDAFSEVVTQAVARLVSARLFGEALTVSLPISYPSGAFAGVKVSLSGDRCLVSDSALGLREAEMACIGDFYDSAAKEAAERFGVSFDGASMFAASAPLDRVDGAIVAVANASVNAVSKALAHAAEAKERITNTAVFDIVADIFGKSNVARKIEIAGRDALWDAHNVVSIRGQKTIFEYVSDHSNSIANKFLMFSDLVKLEAPPALVSVVHSIDGLGPKGAMLSDVSHVISLTSDRSVFQRYARAA